MARGPKPTPTTTRRLSGNPSRRPFNAHEPEPPALDAWDVPEELDTPSAQAEWTRLAPMLRACRQITAADRAALVALCLEWSRYLEAMREVRVKGLILTASRSGYLMPNPYLSVGMKALANCQKLWPELGLTPSSRSRVRAAGPGEADGDPEEEAFREFDRPPARVS
jgi:P27 family predicted phage terminase small subunit